MKRSFSLFFICVFFSTLSFSQEEYKPSKENLEAREWFQDAKFGLFVHWGVYSILGNGEWVMNNTKIPIKQYEKLPGFFYPMHYDPAEWVKLVKEAGMKYIVITSKHHDGFAMFDSKVSDYDIVDRTPYGKDVLKMLAEECEKQGVKLFFYYSHLDWHHPKFYADGRTGGDYTGRSGERDFPAYLDYMNTQIEELLTGYGDIGGIWFDGIWDNLDADWQLTKTYDLIHRLQPGCLVGNNHHVAPYPGEDFQMFEKDLPGHNTTGWANDQSVSRLPLETCETISGNGSWGFNIHDKKTKSPEDLIQYMVKAAGYNSNFLLNVGPMPDGNIRPEHIDVLKEMGEWMDKNGGTIYGTRGGPIAPASWGVTTQKDNKVYLHIMDPDGNAVLIEGLDVKIKDIRFFNDQSSVNYSKTKYGLVINIPEDKLDDIDTIIEITTK